MKKFLSILLTLGMVLGIYMVPAHAQAISSNQTINGRTSGNTPITYTYTMPKSGYFYFTIQIIGDTYQYLNDDGITETYDNSSNTSIHYEMKANYRTYVTQILDYGDTDTSSNFSFKKGTKVNISINASEHEGISYTLTLHYSNPKNCEAESNSSRSKTK